ncbi:MAG: stage V sporulation protein T [Clostridia bacterium]|nr:stage V sporulation protein T [Clostridia bacterium]
MKATGVVRRIDDLGRVVIPKEIRKVLRIKEGDPLEIFTDQNGEVVLKKYSPIGELSEFAGEYAETLSKTTGHIACITDKDTVIAVSGGNKKEFLEKNLSKEIEEILENKEIFKSKENDDISLPITENEGKQRIYNSQVIYPIISDGDVVGSVILLAKDASKAMGEPEFKVAQSAAGFLGSHLEI